MEESSNNINLSNMVKLFSSSKWKNRLMSPPFLLISFVSGCLLSVLCFYMITTNFKTTRFVLSNDVQLRDEHVSLAQHSPKTPEVRSQANENEALGSLKIALEMKLIGKDEKALRLFKHSLALAPNHPEVLTHYGEFLEYRKDLVSADQYYYKALIIEPKHNKALVNIQRTGENFSSIPLFFT